MSASYYDGLQRIFKGTTERIYTEYKDSNGVLTTPSNPKVQIFDSTGALFVATTNPTPESTGVYYYEVTVGTSSAVAEGMYTAYWWGTIGGTTVSMDVPQFFWVQKKPAEHSQADDLVMTVRRLIGDTNPNNYRIATHDIHYFIKDAVDQVQVEYNMGYHVTVTPTSVTFDKALSQTPITLFSLKTAELILTHVLMDVLLSGVNVTVGDIKINMSDTIRARREYLKDLKKDFSDLLKNLKIASSMYAGSLVNTYLDASGGRYNLSYWG